MANFLKMAKPELIADVSLMKTEHLELLEKNMFQLIKNSKAHEDSFRERNNPPIEFEKKMEESKLSKMILHAVVTAELERRLESNMSDFAKEIIGNVVIINPDGTFRETFHPSQVSYNMVKYRLEVRCSLN